MLVDINNSVCVLFICLSYTINLLCK